MDDRMEARLRDEVIVAGYQALPDVYEWLIPDAKLTPEGSVAALGDLVQSLPSNARVLKWDWPACGRPRPSRLGCCRHRRERGDGPPDTGTR
jgi:hypothetical protein